MAQGSTPHSESSMPLQEDRQHGARTAPLRPERPRPNFEPAPRIAIFTHDTFGLGHVRRCLHIVRALAERAPEAAILFITGSPALHAFSRLPQNADYVKIPTIVQTGTKETQPPNLAIETREVVSIRKKLIRSAVDSFRPDVFLVDNFPLGVRKELIPALERLRQHPTRTVLGLRDILDQPDIVQGKWRTLGVYEALEQLYDQILVYGIPEVLDVVESYDLSKEIGDKVRYCGYVTSKAPSDHNVEALRDSLGLKRPLVLATVGGGGDGYPLLQNFLRAVEPLSDISALVVTGPLMAPVDRARLSELAEQNDRVVLRDFVPDLPAYMAAADVVVTMGGYNTTAELLALRRPAIVVPRNWRYGEYSKGTAAGVEWEQLMRAQAMEKLGLADIILPEDLTPALLSERITAALARPGDRAIKSYDTGGVERVVDHILALAVEARQRHDAA